ncbi:MAG TPA: hypothetical protein PK416_10705 [Thermodesulfobacteriota bacterium]|nr:hypothetical protein [Thermodesulfobacteriota bacterium]
MKRFRVLLALLFYFSILPILPGWAAPVIDDLRVKKTPWVDVTAHMSALTYVAWYVAPSLVDVTSEMKAAIAAVDNNGTILLPKGTYVLGEDVVVQKDNVTVTGWGATIKMKDDFYTYGNYQMMTFSGRGLSVVGVTFDGNKANQTTGNMNGVKLTSLTDAKFLYCTWVNFGYHAIFIQDVVNLLVLGNRFTNCYGEGNAAEIYSSGAGNTGAFVGNYYSRDIYPWNTDNTNGGQAYYMHAGEFTYTGDSMDNVSIGYDFRSGHHVVSGVILRNVNTVLQAGTTGKNPTVDASHIDARGVNGCDTHCGSTVSGFNIFSGDVRISDVRAVALDTSTTLSWMFRVQHSAADNAYLSSVVLSNIDSTGPSAAHYYVNLADNSVTIDRATVRNRGYAAVGFRTESNTGIIYVRNPVLDNIATPFTNSDGMQRVSGTDNSCKTEGGDKVAYDNVAFLTVTHGLCTGITPNSFTISFDNTNVGKWSVSNEGTSTFKISTDNAVVGANVRWKAEKVY